MLRTDTRVQIFGFFRLAITELFYCCCCSCIGVKCHFNPLPDNKYFDSSKQFADNNFKFDENGRKLSKRVENTVGKGEIARYEQFLLFPQCFQKACFPRTSKGAIVWEWVKTKVISWRSVTYMCFLAFSHQY